MAARAQTYALQFPRHRRCGDRSQRSRSERHGLFAIGISCIVARGGFSAAVYEVEQFAVENYPARSTSVAWSGFCGVKTFRATRSERVGSNAKSLLEPG